MRSINTRLVGLLTVCALTVAAHAAHAKITVTDGPIVLHASVTGQWGGHTFPYVLRGERYIFWTGTLNEYTEVNGEKRYLKCLVGQSPLPGTHGEPAVYTLDLAEPGAYGTNIPLMLRTPDGYLHLFVAINHHTDNPQFGYGSVRYFRSVRAENVTQWVDRTDRIPLETYRHFHSRTGVAVTPDGQRAVLQILAISEDGSVPFNTPIIFLGRREGLDFRFDPPVKYHGAMSFFYPIVAALPEDIVLVGQVWDVQSHVTGRIVHLDWSGAVQCEQELPAPEQDGAYHATDMRPERPGDWNSLIIYQPWQPADRSTGHHFLRYDVAARRLEAVRKLAVDYGVSNPGKWLPIGPSQSLFINNPSMGRYRLWEGDILGGGELTTSEPPLMDAIKAGYVATGYTMVPSPFCGSVSAPSEAYVMTDAYSAGKKQEDRGPCSLLLWRLDLGSD